MLKKILYLCFKIVTFGGYLTKKKAKKEAQQINTCLKRSSTTNLNVLDLIQQLGGADNITGLRSRINLIIVNLMNPKLADLSGLKNSGAKGIMANNKELRIIFGDDSQAIVDQMNEMIKKTPINNQ